VAETPLQWPPRRMLLRTRTRVTPKEPVAELVPPVPRAKGAGRATTPRQEYASPFGGPETDPPRTASGNIGRTPTPTRERRTRGEADHRRRSPARRKGLLDPSTCLASFILSGHVGLGLSARSVMTPPRFLPRPPRAKATLRRRRKLGLAARSQRVAETPPQPRQWPLLFSPQWP
jgi:hypothetical protein